MVRSLAQVTITAGSLFQTQTNYRTGDTIITANGKPIVACTTRDEAEDMMTYLNDRKPKPRRWVPSPALIASIRDEELFQ